MASSASSRRNSNATSTGGSRRGSCDSDGGFPFSSKLKRGKHVSAVKLVFMGKSMELLVPMNEDINIYDGESIDGSIEAKSKSNWVEMFDMIDLAFNNLQQQNKDLRRTVNELSSKINKLVFHERKEESNNNETNKMQSASEKSPEYNMGQVQEINKKMDNKIMRVEENILQWIDEETKTLKDTLEKDIVAIRSEVDEKNIELNSKVQTSIADLKEDFVEKVNIIENKLVDNMFENTNEFIAVDSKEQSPSSMKAILELKNKLHQNCNTLRFLCSEPLSVQFSVWNKNEIEVPRGEERCLCFNWINCDIGGAIDDDGVSDISYICIPISGPYLLSIGCKLTGHAGAIVLRRNKKEKIMEGNRCDIVDLNEGDILQVFAEGGSKMKDVSLMGILLRPRGFVTHGTTM